MPTVPRRQDSLLQQSAIPNVSFDPSISLEALGAGESVNQLTNAVTGFANTANQIAQEQKQRADDIATTEAYSKLVTAKNRLFWDRENGAYTRRGKDAFGVVDEYTLRFDQEADFIEGKLKNDEQRAIFKRMRDKERLEFDNFLQRHLFDESNKYDDEVTNSALDASMQDAVSNFHDPGKIDEILKLQSALIQANAERKGMSSEFVKSKTQEAHSKTIESVVDRMLANGQDQLAREYYSQVKKRVSGDDAAQIERSLRAGFIKGESQRLTDEILQSATTLNDGLEEARKIDDPDIRDAVVQRVKRRFSELKNLDKQDLDNRYLEAAQSLRQNPGQNPMDVIPPSVFARLTTSQQKALFSYSQSGNSSKKFAEFLDLTPDQIAGLSLSDFETKYWSSMSEENREQAQQIWSAAKKDKKDPNLTRPLSFQKSAKNALIQSGLYPSVSKQVNEDDARLLVDFQQSLANDLTQFEIAKGKKASFQEMQQLIDEKVSKQVFIQRRFRRDPQRIASLVQGDDRERAYVPFDQIPQESLENIRRQAKISGRPLTREKAERVYAAALLGDDERIRTLLRR